MFGNQDFPNVIESEARTDSRDRRLTEVKSLQKANFGDMMIGTDWEAPSSNSKILGRH